jgi:hypothetical protein
MLNLAIDLQMVAFLRIKRYYWIADIQVTQKSPLLNFSSWQESVFHCWRRACWSKVVVGFGSLVKRGNRFL